MGNSLNPLKSPEPVYNVICTRPIGYEVRVYMPYFVAEVDNSAADNSNAFRTLASYIGVFSKPANTQSSTGKPQGISMTAPVVMPQAPSSSSPEAISMTTPVVQSGKTMQFIMPSSYTTLSSLPKPTDPRVHLKEVPGKTVGVIRYSGKATNVMTHEKLQLLKERLQQETLLPKECEEVDWMYCGYDPPFTPGPFRRNEVWVDLKMSEEDVKAKLAAVDGK